MLLVCGRLQTLCAASWSFFGLVTMWYTAPQFLVLKGTGTFQTPRFLEFPTAPTHRSCSSPTPRLGIGTGLFESARGLWGLRRPQKHDHRRRGGVTAFLMCVIWAYVDIVVLRENTPRREVAERPLWQTIPETCVSVRIKISVKSALPFLTYETQ